MAFFVAGYSNRILSISFLHAIILNQPYIENPIAGVDLRKGTGGTYSLQFTRKRKLF